MSSLILVTAYEGTVATNDKSRPIDMAKHFINAL
jgi:hypothetical protein